MTPSATVSSPDRHLPLVGRRLQQHHARDRAATADIVLRAADAAAAAGRHVAPDAFAGEVAAGGDPIDRDLLPIAFELFGHELGEAGERALAHLRAGDPDHAGVVGLDHDPGIDLGALGALRGGRLDAERHVETERQSAAGGGCGADDEVAARKLCGVAADGLCHGVTPQPFDASLAAMMHGRADALIGAAATDVGHRLVDVLVGRLRRLLEQRRRCHDLAGLAVAALRHVDREPSLLHRVRAVGREALDGDDRVGRLHVADADRARALHLAVDVHGAGAALRDAAAVFRAGETDLLADHP